MLRAVNQDAVHAPRNVGSELVCSVFAHENIDASY